MRIKTLHIHARNTEYVTNFFASAFFIILLVLQTFSVQLDENTLTNVIGSTQDSAYQPDRLDVMKALASIVSIRIRANLPSNESSPITLFIANITMDVAVTDNSSLPKRVITGTTEIELCQCPQGYAGTSCEVLYKEHLSTAPIPRDWHTEGKRTNFSTCIRVQRNGSKRFPTV